MCSGIRIGCCRSGGTNNSISRCQQRTLSQVLQPPTDNLYKFMAVFGLVIIVTSAVLLQKSADSYIDSSIESSYVFAKSVDASIADNHRRMALLDRLGEAAKANDTALFNELKFQLNSSPLVSAQSPEWKKQERMSDVLLQRAEQAISLGFVGVLLGAGLSIAGFRLWYLRVQRYLDQQLKVGSPHRVPFRARI